MTNGARIEDSERTTAKPNLLLGVVMLGSNIVGTGASSDCVGVV